jgi:WD40 repeat protein
VQQPDTENIFFSDIERNTIYMWNPSPGFDRATIPGLIDPAEVGENNDAFGGTLSIFRRPSGRANGLAFDASGNFLYAAEGADHGDGNRRITKTSMKDGSISVVADSFRGKPLNSPNDIGTYRECVILQFCLYAVLLSHCHTWFAPLLSPVCPLLPLALDKHLVKKETSFLLIHDMVIEQM